MSWVATDAFGTRFYFGSSDESRVQNGGRIYEWNLDRIEDTSGNFTVLRYKQIDGFWYLESVAFSGNSVSALPPSNRLALSYEPRPGDDRAIFVESGLPLRITQRVSAVDVFAQDAPYASYKLGYRQSAQTGRSLLTSITRVFAGSSLPPLRFEYSDTVASDPWQLQVVDGPARTFLPRNECLTGDFNGDGRMDMACATDPGGSWNVGLSKGSADSSTDRSAIHQTYNGFDKQTWAGPPIARVAPLEIPFSGPDLFSPDRKVQVPDVMDTCISGDFDADSRTDIACYDAAKDQWNVGLSDGRKFAVQAWRNGPQLSAAAGTTKPLGDRCVAGDFDGDGRTDLACYVGRGPSSDHSTWSVALSTGQSWRTSNWTGVDIPTTADATVSGWCIAADFNGDRRTDIACYDTSSAQWHISMSVGSGFDTTATPNGPAMPPILAPIRPTTVSPGTSMATVQSTLPVTPAGIRPRRSSTAAGLSPFGPSMAGKGPKEPASPSPKSRDRTSHGMHRR